MLRNLKMRNGLPFEADARLAEEDRPGLSILISSATSSRNGSRTSNPTVATSRSTPRFSIAQTQRRWRRRISRRVSATRSTSLAFMPGNSGSEMMRCHSRVGDRASPRGATSEDVAVVAVLVQRNEVHAGADARRGQLAESPRRGRCAAARGARARRTGARRARPRAGRSAARSASMSAERRPVLLRPGAGARACMAGEPPSCTRPIAAFMSVMLYLKPG